MSNEEPIFEIETVTPQTAAKYLEHNVMNRSSTSPPTRLATSC